MARNTESEGLMDGKSNVHWISIDDSPSPVQELIWFYVEQDRRICYGHRAGDEYFDSEQGDSWLESWVTHWAPFVWPGPP